MTECIKRPTSYWTLCRCAACIEDRARKRKLSYVYGYRRIESDEAWRRLAAMIEADWTPRAIGSATGLRAEFFRVHVTEYHRGRRVYLGPVVAARIMAAGRPTEGQVGAEPTRRRLCALARIGWGLSNLAAEEPSLAFSTLAMARSRNDRVSARVANAVADLYDRLSGTPGPSEQAVRKAEQKGWPAPLDWSDIDDRHAVPWRPEKRPSRGRPMSDTLDEYEFLISCGESRDQALKRLGVTWDAIEKAIERRRMREAS